MKSIILSFSFLLLFNSLKAQVLNYKAKYLCVSKPKIPEKDRIWAECNTLVIIDTVNNTLHIYTDKEEKYDIVKYLAEDQKDNYYTLTFKIVDKKGVEGTMGLSLVKDQSYGALLTILKKGYLYFYKMINNN